MDEWPKNDYKEIVTKKLIKDLTLFNNEWNQWKTYNTYF